MELRTMELFNFRRFDRAKLNLSGRLTAIVGPNEAGKTSLLRALNYFSSGKAISAFDRSIGSEAEAMLVLTFRLTHKQCESVGVDRGSTLQVQKRQNGEFECQLTPTPDRDLSRRKKLSSKLEALDHFDAEVAHGDFSHADVHRVLPSLLQSESEWTSENVAFVQSAIAMLSGAVSLSSNVKLDKFRLELSDLLKFERSHDPNDEATSKLIGSIPKIVEFSDDRRVIELPYQLSHFKPSDKANHKPPSKPVLQLLELCGLEMSELVHLNKKGHEAAKEGRLEEANLKLKAISKGTWNQSDASLKIFVNNGQLDIMVEHGEGFEGLYKYHKFGERSDGYKQFIALQIFILKENIADAIILIDEIEHHLHYDAQADLVQMLQHENRLGRVVYTTHSLGALPEDLGNGVRHARWKHKKRRNSEVVNKFWADGLREGLSPLLFGMGATTLSFLPVRNALICEGPTELLLVPPIIREVLESKSVGFQVVPGLSNISFQGIELLDQLHKRAAFLLDGDDGGADLKKNLVNAGVAKERIFSLSMLGDVETIEDVLEETIWVEAVNRVIEDFPDLLKNEAPLETAGSSGRVKSLSAELSQHKINIAYAVLDILADEPDRTLIAPSLLENAKELAESVRSGFKIQHL